MRKPQARVEYVLPNSLGDKAGIKAGDIINSINGHDLRDMIDYELCTADENLTLEILREDGKNFTVTLEKSFDEDLGISFESAVFDGVRRCANNCVFCFVDQMAPNRRETLYVKDDDYRLSFLYGNYVTLTNLKEEDFRRIEEERLSPIYVSVHATDGQIRTELLGRKKSPDIMEKLKRLIDNGIDIHGQVVLVPTVNDGEVLAQTVADLTSLGDGFLSLALVPVGLTRYHKNGLRVFTKTEANAVIDFAEGLQEKFLAERGTRFIFPSDEFYFLAERPIPNDEYYEDYSQIENGVGLVRLFNFDFEEGLWDMPENLSYPKPVRILTGKDGALAIAPAVAELKRRGLDIDTISVENKLLGPTVTVTGLLCGADLADAINAYGADKAMFLISDIVLKDDGSILLDDWSIDDLREKTGAEIDLVGNSGGAFAEYCCERFCC